MPVNRAISGIKQATKATHGGRHVVTYRLAHSVYLKGGKFAAMSGFRFHGQWSRDGQKVVQLPATVIGCVATDSGQAPNLGAGMTAPTFENWYAVFACANDGDTTATIVTMPFLRVRDYYDPGGSNYVVRLNKAGEGIHTQVEQTYAWNAAQLAGAECLVISETIDGRSNAFSGRTLTLASAGSTSLQIDKGSIGGINALDWLLPAPPGFAHFRYLGAFYYDTAEIRNIADSGSVVKSYGINIAQSLAASVPSPTRYDVGGYICPLATGVVLYSNGSLSGSQQGSFAEYFAMDGSAHTVQNTYYTKALATTDTWVFDGITVPFSFGQYFYYSNAGALAPNRTGQQLRPMGWVEI